MNATLPKLTQSQAALLLSSYECFTCLYWRKASTMNGASIPSFKSFKSLGLAVSEFEREASLMRAEREFISANVTQFERIELRAGDLRNKTLNPSAELVFTI